MYTLGTGGLVYVRSMDDPESINAIHSTLLCAMKVDPIAGGMGHN